MNSILFVCLGNICRSPLAEGVAKKISTTNKLNITVESAGTGSWHIGQSPCANSIKVAAQHGIDISAYKGQQVQKSDFDTFDLVVALDESNLKDLQALGCTNLVKLGDFGFNGEDVPDPFFFTGFEGFEKVFGMIEEAVTLLLKKHFHAI